MTMRDLTNRAMYAAAGADTGVTPAAAVAPAADGAAAAATAAAAAAAASGTPPAAANGEWRASLPEAVQQWEEAGTAQSADQFWEGMTNMRGRMGQSVRVPSGEAGPEDWAAFSSKMTELAPGRFTVIPDRDSPEQMAAYHKSVGVPEKAEDYLNVDNPEGVELNHNEIGAFKAIAHKWGLTPDQFKGVVLDFNASSRAQQAEAAKPMTAATDALKGEWGAAYDQRNAAVVSMLTHFKFPPQVIEAFTNSQADAASIKSLYSIAEALGGEGGQLLTDAPGGGPGVAMTPAEAEARIAEIQRSPDYTSTDVLVRKAAVERMVALQKFASPNTANQVQTFG